LGNEIGAVSPDASEIAEQRILRKHPFLRIQQSSFSLIRLYNKHFFSPIRRKKAAFFSLFMV
jgi:hypothetical protein